MTDEQKLILGCRNQEQQSQEKLYKQFYPALFAMCRTFFSDPHDTLTAVNNGMLKVFQNIDQYDASKGTLFSWVYTIVRNAALNLVRDRKNPLTYELTDDLQRSSASNPFKQLEWKDIYFYLDQLPEKTRCVCSLYYLEGFSIKEITESIDMKEGAVKWHLSECRKKLKQIFENQNRQQIG